METISHCAVLSSSSFSSQGDVLLQVINDYPHQNYVNDSDVKFAKLTEKVVSLSDARREQEVKEILGRHRAPIVNCGRYYPELQAEAVFLRSTYETAYKSGKDVGQIYGAVNALTEYLIAESKLPIFAVACVRFEVFYGMSNLPSEYGTVLGTVVEYVADEDEDVIVCAHVDVILDKDVSNG